jgi:hypothetical protein
MSLISRVGNWLGDWLGDSWPLTMPAGTTPASASASGTIHRNVFMLGLVRLNDPKNIEALQACSAAIV